MYASAYFKLSNKYIRSLIRILTFAYSFLQKINSVFSYYKKSYLNWTWNIDKQTHRKTRSALASRIMKKKFFFKKEKIHSGLIFFSFVSVNPEMQVQNTRDAAAVGSGWEEMIRARGAKLKIHMPTASAASPAAVYTEPITWRRREETAGSERLHTRVAAARTDCC